MHRLEARRLLAGQAAELIATLPAVQSNINVRFNDLIDVQGVRFMTGHRGGDHEHLYAVASDSPIAIDLFSTVTWPGGDPRIGISGLIEFDGQAYFFANGEAGDGLYRSNGTPAGTEAVKIFRPPANTLPGQTFILNDKLYFFWNDLNQPHRLYASDGTAAGTQVAWTAPPDTFASNISQIIDGHFFFSAGGKLWRSDGTDAGTAAAWTFPDQNDIVSEYTLAGNKLFFIVSSFGSGPRRLYVANRDGSDATKINIPYNNPIFEAYVSPGLAAVGEKLIFESRNPQSHGARLFVTDGTDAGTIQIAGGMVGIYDNELSRPLSLGNGKVVFYQTSVDGNLTGLWASDGTVAGTQRILASGGLDLLNTDLFVSNGLAYIRTGTGDFGLRMLQTDGTAAGTRVIHYLEPGRALRSWKSVFLDTLDERIVAQGSIDGIAQLWSFDTAVQTGSIGGVAWFDFNRNGTREMFESALPGTVYFDLDGDSKLSSDADAARSVDNNPYRFDGLVADEQYVVRFQPYGIYESAAITYPPGGQHVIDLQPGQQVLDADFRSWGIGATIWGTVYNDIDADGVRDPGEAGVHNQQLYIDRNLNGLYDGVDPLVTTATDGTYAFTNQPAGEHVIRRRDQVGWEQIDPPNRGSRVVTIAADGLAEAPFGIIAAAPGSITGMAWTDWNQDGLRDGGDTPRAGLLLYLDVNGDGLRQPSAEPAVTSDSLGRFTFTQIVPGPYTVRLLSPGLTQTAPPAGTGLPVTVTSGVATFAGELMVYSSTQTPPSGSIAGAVFFDADGDGLQDAGEGGIAGRTVYIDADNSNTLTPTDSIAVTDASGAFLFTHRTSGTYRLRQVVPAGWSQTTQGGSGAITATVPAAGLRFGAALVAPLAGGPYQVDEGQSLALAASAPAGLDPATLTWTWDLNNDGVFGDATGQSTTITWDQLVALGINDGPANWSLRARYAQGSSASPPSAAAPLSVRDVAPDLTLDGAAEVLIERPCAISFAASDAGDDPVLAWLIDWGDGMTSEIAGGSAATALHAYAVGGREYTITLTARQQDGDFVATHTVRVLTPHEVIDRMAESIDATDLNRGNSKSLLRKLAEADEAFAAGDRAAAGDALRELLGLVDHWQRVRKLSPADAEPIRAAAAELLALTAP